MSRSTVRSAALALAAGLAALACLAALPAAAATRCVRPDARRLAARLDPMAGPPSGVSLKMLPLPGAGRLRWAAVSWAAPADGAVAVVDCAGRALATEPVGPILSLRPGPMVDGAPTLLAFYRRDAGAGFSDQAVVLLRWSAPRLAAVWRHQALALAEAGGAGRTVTVAWRWRFSPDGRTIRLGGERTWGPPPEVERSRARSLTRRLRSSTYCWIPGRRRFDRCAS